MTANSASSTTNTAAALVDICTKFLRGFKKGKKYIYNDQLFRLKPTEPLVIDYIDLESLPLNSVIGKDTEELLMLVVEKPYEAIRAFEEAAKSIIDATDPDADTSSLHVRFKNIPVEVEIPQIRVEQVGKLISTTGSVNMIENKDARPAIRVLQMCSLLLL